jgi:hypothetical protein
MELTFKLPLQLLLLSHSYCHHVEALETPSSSCFCTLVVTTLKLLTTRSTLEALVMEVSAKGGGWGGVQRDEGGRWVGVGVRV